MKLKDIKLKKLIEILIITAAVSTMLLGLVVWIFNIPAYFRGEKGAYAMTPENSISVNVNKTYEIEDITSIEVDLLFSDIDVMVSDGDSVSFVYSGSAITKPEFKEPFLLFNKTLGKLSIKTTLKSSYSVANSSIVLKLLLPENKIKELKLSTSSGDITIFGNTSERLILNTSSGEIAVNGFTSSELYCDSSSGDQDFINLDVDILKLNSSSGKVTIDDSHSGKTEIETSSGDLNIHGFTSKDSKVETTSGRIQIEDYSGNLNLNSSSGSIYVVFGQEGDEIIADTSAGNVTLIFKKTAGFKIETDTSSGDFEIDFPLTLQENYNEDHMNGIVGDGIGLVKINTSSGDIKIIQK